MKTAGDIITDAFKKAGILGVGQSLDADDMQGGLDNLTDLVAQWQRKRWMVWHLVDTGLVSQGLQSYTVAPGGDFNMMRPDKLEYAYFRQVLTSPNLPVDYPLTILTAYEDYADIALKTLKSWPSYIFYDSGWPTGRVFPWPIPNADLYEIHLVTKEQLPPVMSVSQGMNFPPEYIPAMRWNVLEYIKASYPEAQENPIAADRQARLARNALNVIRIANAQIPRMKMPRELARSGRYNVFSDSTRGPR
jgi:hypothetical protein